MKNLYFVFILVLIFAFTQTSNAQFFDKLKKKAEQEIKKEGERRAEDKVKKGVNKGYDELENTVTGSKDEKKEEQKKVEQKSSDVKTTNTESQNSTQTTQPLIVSSKYDFIPGEKVLFFDDFSAENIGDFPTVWNTTGSGEIVTTNTYDGRWFRITNPRGIYTLMEPLTLPENYTIEFDLVPQPYSKTDKNTQFNFYLLNTPKPKVMNYGLALPGGNGIKFTFAYSNYYSAYYSDGTPGIGGSEDGPRLAADKKYRISVWVQKTRIRLYVDQEKVFDLPKVVPLNPRYNMIRFSDGSPMIANFRVATGLPDMRSKLLTEGKLISYGIYFDVNKSIVKPESYPSIKEIATILKDNPNVRIKIVGHTDSDGDDKSNLELSKNRSASVKNELVNSFSIDASRIETDGKGEIEPIAPNDNTTNKALNRRVEFIKL